MPSTYTTNLGIELPADGELDGVWGDVVNENMDILDRAINGSVALTLSGTASTLTTSDGALSDGQYKLLVLGGTPSGTHTITIAPSDAQKIYFVRNTTAQSVVFTQGSGGNVTIATGDSAIVYSDGAGGSAAVANITNDFAMSSVKITGGTIDGTVIGGSSAAAGTFTTAAATTGNITTVNATTVDTTNIEVTTLKAKDGTSAGSIADSTGVVTLASSVLTTTDINGGTVDGAVIGGSSAAAITGTTITATGDVTIADKIIHTGDTDTAIRFPAADTVTVETGGSERVRINASGNVGIGTSSPSQRLSVQGDGAISRLIGSGGDFQGLQIQCADASGSVTKNVFIDAINESGVAVASQTGAILPDGGSFWSWSTQPAGTRTDRRVERARIDASGNLLVGGTTGATNRRLSVVGGHIFNSTNNDHLYGNFNEAADTAIWEVRSAQTKNANFGFVEAGVAERWAVGIKGGDASLIFASGSANIATATERARIDSSGNLLVGTTALGGSSSNAALIIGGGIRTAAGFLSSIASGTATTAFSITAANRGRYEVVAMIANSGDASIYSAISTVIWDGTTGRAVSNNGTLFTITLSGSNVQVTQISGSAQDVYWSFQRIAL
jgi:hypothetical protein